MRSNTLMPFLAARSCVINQTGKFVLFLLIVYLNVVLYVQNFLILCNECMQIFDVVIRRFSPHAYFLQEYAVLQLYPFCIKRVHLQTHLIISISATIFQYSRSSFFISRLRQCSIKKTLSFICFFRNNR